MIWLLGCASERSLTAERTRPLGAVEVAGERFPVSLDERRWRRSPGFSHDGFTRGGDEVVVSLRVDGAGGRVRGHPDHVWTFDDPPEARALFGSLRLDGCATFDHAAYRVGSGWRWLAPVGPGGVAELVPVPDDATCDDALGRWPSAEAWLRGAASHPDTCVHLAHLRRREDAVACLLRQSPDTPLGPASRVDLPNAPNDAGFDDDLLAVLSDPSTRGDGFAPYRVVGLLAELDGAQKAALTDVLAARATRPWEVAALAALDPARIEALALSPGTPAARIGAAAAALPVSHPWWKPAPAEPGFAAPWLPARPCDPATMPSPGVCP